MSTHRASIQWRRESDDFGYESYNREHDWHFEGGSSVRASAAPGFRGDPDCVDPEEAFVASLSSCHMLTFLALCAKKRWLVDTYDDQAVGHLEKNDSGRLAITRVQLRPRVVFGGADPPPEQVRALHEQAHRHCFIASSVLTDVVVEPQEVEAAGNSGPDSP